MLSLPCVAAHFQLKIRGGASPAGAAASRQQVRQRLTSDFLFVQNNIGFRCYFEFIRFSCNIGVENTPLIPKQVELSRPVSGEDRSAL